MRFPWWCLVVGVLAVSRPVLAQCGGVERWAVKMGADVTAAALATRTPVATTLHDIVRLARPTLPSDDVTRAAGEDVVHVLDAYLVRFKKEGGKSGDQDYHLVISDQTLLYSTSGSGNVSPHSLIAEIPDPQCVSGSRGTVAGPSHLASQLAAARTAFESQFPNVSGGWNDVGGLPVRLTGVTFFDRPHGQVGRALNGLELHPLLGIEFNPANFNPDGPGAPFVVASNLLANGDFDSGAVGWMASPGVLDNGTTVASRSGPWKAWLGGHGEVKADTLWQQVALPNVADAIALTFYVHIETEEESPTVYDRLRVRVRDANGTLLKTVATFTNVDAAPGYQRRTVDLSAYRGQTIRLSLESSEDGASATSFVVDDVQIIAEKP